MLNKIIATYKAREHLYQAGSKSGYSKLIMTQEQIKVKTEEFLKGRDYFPKDYLAYISKKFGSDGTERRKVIKHAFKVIFDNLLPDSHKLFMYYNKVANLIPKEEVAAKLKKLKGSKRAASELAGDPHELFYGLLQALDLDKEQKKQFSESQMNLYSIYKEYQEVAHSLVKNRNRFLKSMGRLRSYIINDVLKLLTAKQVISFNQYFRKNEHSSLTQFHQLWEIKKTKKKESKDEEVALSYGESSESSDFEVPPVSESVIKSIEGDKADT
mmetsp:Transcript_7800/g.7366  ORF Transcript_7800/g.7366 Transcript_7800/m.7366 type:complete len:270 (-) Transcript_7800:236-1045(-)